MGCTIVLIRLQGFRDLANWGFTDLGGLDCLLGVDCVSPILASQGSDLAIFLVGKRNDSEVFWSNQKEPFVLPAFCAQAAEPHT